MLIRFFDGGYLVVFLLNVKLHRFYVIIQPLAHPQVFDSLPSENCNLILEAVDFGNYVLVVCIYFIKAISDIIRFDWYSPYVQLYFALFKLMECLTLLVVLFYHSIVLLLIVFISTFFHL
jgi:hypothetical protein